MFSPHFVLFFFSFFLSLLIGQSDVRFLKSYGYISIIACGKVDHGPTKN